MLFGIGLSVHFNNDQFSATLMPVARAKNCFLISRAFGCMSSYNVSFTFHPSFRLYSIFFSVHFCVMWKLAALTGFVVPFHNFECVVCLRRVKFRPSILFFSPFAIRMRRKPYAKTEIVMVDGPTMTSHDILFLRQQQPPLLFHHILVCAL